MLMGALAAPVIPNMAGLGAPQGASEAECRSHQKPEVFPVRIQVDFAIGSYQGMLVQDDDTFAGLPSSFLKTPAQIDLFRSIQFQVKPSKFPKRAGITKDERAREQPRRPADEIPESRNEPRRSSPTAEPDGASSRQASSRIDRFYNVGK